MMERGRRMRLGVRRTLVLTLLVSCVARLAAAQQTPRFFAGALMGLSTLSADGRAVTGESDAAVSLYKPENGAAVDLFAGADIAQYLSLQANWMWNRNDLSVVSAFVGPDGGGFYEQRRRSRQHAAVFDVLVYFRRMDSAVRPYLGTGLSVVHFASGAIAGGESRPRGLTPPPDHFASTRVGVRSHVGVDIRLTRRLSFRYSFSETISGNPISPFLTPAAPRRLANFQNLFGAVARL